MKIGDTVVLKDGRSGELVNFVISRYGIVFSIRVQESVIPRGFDPYAIDWPATEEANDQAQAGE